VKFKTQIDEISTWIVGFENYFAREIFSRLNLANA